MDFSEFETEAGGPWNYAPVVDYWAKSALAAETSITKTADDAIASVQAAITEAERLLGITLLDDCTDKQTGEITAVILVTDNGPAFKAIKFARFIDSRKELTHVRTRVRSPGTNGVVERWIGSPKYERLYREPIPDGHALQTQLDDYRDYCNTVRPHQAIGGQLPITRYLAEPENDQQETKEAHIDTA